MPLATLDISGNTATLTLNRPEARNALSIELLADLHARVDELAKRVDVSVVTVTGAGKAFCAGMDLKAVLGNHELALALLTSLGELTVKIRLLPQVVVARVNGAAIGGGCGLTTVCDFAITHADSRMGFPEVDLGVCPAVVAPWLTRRLGAGRARAVNSETSQAFAEAQEQKTMDFIRGADVLILDSQYDSQEYQQHVGWGHGCVDYAVSLAMRSEVKKLFLFHHDPDHDDAKLDEMLAHARQIVIQQKSTLLVEAATEGRVVELAVAKK